jgi:hypothetical protein
MRESWTLNNQRGTVLDGGDFSETMPPPVLHEMDGPGLKFSIPSLPLTKPWQSGICWHRLAYPPMGIKLSDEPELAFQAFLTALNVVPADDPGARSFKGDSHDFGAVRWRAAFSSSPANSRRRLHRVCGGFL